MKKIKNKKSLLAIVAAMFIVAIGVTYAVFNSVSSKENEFNLGNYSFITMESFESPTDWLPGETIDKTIYGMNNGDIPVAFRIKYEERWEDASGDPIANVPNDAVTINFINRAHWEYNSDDGYYYHKYFIAASDSSCTLISGVTLNEDLMGSASCEMVGDTYTCTSDFDGLSGAKYILTFTKEAVAYNKYQEFWNTDEVITEEPPLVQIMNSERTKDTLQVGDEICVNGPESTECFNFIGYDGNNIKMLSKWNLNVGSGSKGPETNLQDSDVRGYKSGMTKYGVVTFSETNYWEENDSLKSKYGSSYPTDVYDTDYSDATGTNYSVAYYVENYKDILETYGLTVQSARLLTYAEATDASIGCSGRSCPTNGFITNTSFWLGSAGYSYDIMFVESNGTFDRENFDYNFMSYGALFGVRPVIVIPKSTIE